MSIGVFRVIFFAAVVVLAGQEPLTAIRDLIQAHKLTEARSALSSALKTRPNDPDLWNLLGVVSAQSGDVSAAANAFRKAVRLAPRSEAAWLNLGRLYQMSAKGNQSLDNGISAYQTVLSINPENAEAHHQLALLLQWKGKFGESLAHLDRLPPEDRGRRAAMAVRCADEAALGNSARALQIAEELLLDPTLEEADILAILPVIESRNEEVTLRLLEGLESRRLVTAAVLPRLAMLYEHRGDFQRARAALEKAFAASPATADLLELAKIAWKQKDYEGTLGYLAHARDLEPKNAGIHFFFGVTCNEMNLPVEARKSLEKALELAPDNPYYNYAMGSVQLQWSDKRQAVPFLKKFAALRPSDARGHLALATAYFELYQPDQAKAELAIPLQNPQTRAGAEYLMGRIAEQQDHPDEAIQHFRRLIEFEPKSAEGHAELGSLLLEDDAVNSRREMDIALSLEPENYLANRTLLKFYQLAGDPRVTEQSERLQKLIENRDARIRLLQRTIDVRPW